MLSYIIRRLFFMVVTLLVVSVIGFIIIQLPPGDYVTFQIELWRAQGTQINQSLIDGLIKRYGLDLPIYQQYFKWM